MLRAPCTSTMKIHDSTVCVPLQAVAPVAASNRPEHATAEVGPGPGPDPRERASADRARARTATTVLRGAATTTGTQAQPRVAPRTPDTRADSASADRGGTVTEGLGEAPDAMPSGASGTAPVAAGPTSRPEHAAAQVVVTAARATRDSAGGAAHPLAVPLMNQPPSESQAPPAPPRGDLLSALMWALGVWAAVVCTMLLLQSFSQPGSRTDRDSTPEAGVLQQRREEQEEEAPALH